MWIPTTTAEIERVVAAGELSESVSFDAKERLPDRKRNANLAIDIAAMTTDGGVLLYGVAEDDHKQPTLLEPIELAGAPERIAQVAASSISEPPFIEVKEFQIADDPSRGYIAVMVPQSPRAPHQVTVGGDLRFYGRDAKGNRLLTQGEIERLYQRRESWAVDRDSILDNAISRAPVIHSLAPGHLHAFVRPVQPDQEMLERAITRVGGAREMHQWLLGVAHSTKLGGAYAPCLERAAYWDRRGADEWCLSTRSTNARSDAGDVKDLVDLNLNLNGAGHLFCGRATDRHPSDNVVVIIEGVIAGNLEVLFSVMAELYSGADYHGHVDVGVGLTGLSGANSHDRDRFYMGDLAYPENTHRRTLSVSAEELKNPPAIVMRLLRHFFEATTGREGYTPFAEAH